MHSPKELINIFRLPIGILVIQVVLSASNMYRKHEWIDIPMHFFGGLAIGVSYYFLLRLARREKYLDIPHPWVLFVIGISLVSLTALFWEFGEFSLFIFFGIEAQRGLTDTMVDLLLGLLGGAVGLLFGDFLHQHAKPK